MIRVEPAPEPAGFDEKVRQRGLSAIAELVGEGQLKNRPGRKRKQTAARREDISASKFPDFWTEKLEDLLAAYGRVCAYASFYIHPVTGVASVDHFIPKSRAWNLVYEWSNYRLACSLMNSRKNEAVDVIDPFEIQDDWFMLELVGFQVLPGALQDAAIRRRVLDSIERLKLNDRECRKLREDYAYEYWERGRPFEWLRSHAPFVASELQRQGRLLERDR